jgi:hypothetical protein
MSDETPMPLIDVPAYGIAVMPKQGFTLPNGRPVLMLTIDISTSSAHHNFYLCDASDNYQDIASKIEKMINEAGREARRAQSGLVAVKGGSDGLRTEKQGGQLNGPRRPRPEGPPAA